MEDKQSAIFSTYIDTGEKAWINLNHVASVHSNVTSNHKGPVIIRVTMVNGQEYIMINESKPHERWADQFLHALNAFPGH